MSLLFSIGEGIRGMGKARLAMTLSVSSMILTLLLLGSYLIFALNLNRWITDLREKVEIEVFMEPEARPTSLAQVKQALDKQPEIESVQYVSKEDAAKRFEEEFGQNIYDVLESNPLPPSFIVQLKEPYRSSKKIMELAAGWKNLPEVDEVVYQKMLLAALEDYIRWIQAGAVAAGLFITIISISPIYNTIRLTVYARKDMIYIMRLVGATERFIKRPFLVEGLIQGLIAAVFAILIVFYGVKIVKTFIYPYITMDDRIYVGMLLFAVSIGFVSAGLSVRKYLRIV